MVTEPLVSSLNPHPGCRTNYNFIAIMIKQTLIKWIFFFRQLNREEDNLNLA